MFDVSIAKCDSYEREEISAALAEVLNAFGGLDFVKPGMKIAIKANLVSFMKPEDAATTHPMLLCELVRMLTGRGAEVVIGDSPGGLYNAAYVGKVYKATGMHDVEPLGATLNMDFSTKETKFEEGKVLREFSYTAYLDHVDAIINVCKLKTHGMMGMSGAVKNLFGCIPGIMKPEYHYRFPNHADFARMLVDLNEYFKPTLCICDAVIGMEGNGPTMGTPRKIGAILASRSPYHLDLAMADIIGLTLKDVPTLEAACERGLAPDSAEKLSLNMPLDTFRISDYKNIPAHGSIEFGKGSDKFFGKLTKFFTASALRSVPALKGKMCVGCGVCENICPAKAIKIEKGKAIIDRKSCIRCFCCQEFCPKGAMQVKRTWIAKLLTK